MILVGQLTSMDEEKAVFNNTDRTWTAWSSETEDHE